MLFFGFIDGPAQSAEGLDEMKDNTGGCDD